MKTDKPKIRLPKKEKLHLVQARVPEQHFVALKNANVDMPEFIRQAFADAYDLIKKSK